MNADYFRLLGTFTLGDCQYFIENFLSSMSGVVLYEIIRFTKKGGIDFYGQIVKKEFV